MYFVKVTFANGIEETYKVVETELPKNDNTQITYRIFMYILSHFANQKLQPIIDKLEILGEISY